VCYSVLSVRAMTVTLSRNRVNISSSLKFLRASVMDLQAGTGCSSSHPVPACKSITEARENFKLEEVFTSRVACHGHCLDRKTARRRRASIVSLIDVKNVFYVFYSGHVFKKFFNVFFLFCQRFLFLKTFIENTV